MQGKPSTYFTFDAELERTLHAKLRQTRKARLTASEAEIPISEQELKIKVSENSDTEYDKEREDPVMAKTFWGLWRSKCLIVTFDYNESTSECSKFSIAPNNHPSA